MFGFFKNESDSFKRLWLEHLHGHSSTDREWQEFTALAGRFHFKIIKKEHHAFLVSRTSVSGGRHLLLDTGLLTDTPLPYPWIPEWIRPLYGLKWADGDNLKREGSLRDGIAGWIGEYTARELYFSDPGRFSRLTGSHFDGVQSIPEDMVTLQMSRTGRLFFLSSKARIFLYSPTVDQFQDIGSLRNFMNFCLHSINEKRDWYLDGYSQKADTVYYDIVNI